jgi:hypothetical protein
MGLLFKANEPLRNEMFFGGFLFLLKPYKEEKIMKVGKFFNPIVLFLLFLVFSAPVNAAWTDPFFDIYHDTNEKILLLRTLFSLEKTVISDEELKDYYRKDTLYADSLIFQYELGKRWDCWYKSQCVSFPDNQSKVNQDYYKLFTNGNMLQVYQYFVKSGDFQWWKATSYGVIKVFGIYNNLKDGYKAYRKGFDVMVSYALRSLIFELYPFYQQALSGGLIPSDELFKENGPYESLKFTYEEYINMFVLNGMSENDFKGFLIDIIKNIDIYNNTELRFEIGESILDRAILLGCYKELLVYLSNSIVEQTNYTVLSGLYFTKNNQVSYTISFNGTEFRKGTIGTSITGSFNLPINTDCETNTGEYSIKIVDSSSGKEVDVSYTVIPSYSCDKIAPEYISSVPDNGATNVDINIKNICFKFTEAMGPNFSVKWENIEQSAISTEGTWTSPDTACFAVNTILPYYSAIYWTLNDPSSLSFLADLAGNRLRTTAGYFISGQDPRDVDNDGDGYSENQGDCNDNNPNIYPGATEICGDGIDQDCNGADLICNTDLNRGLVAYYPFDGNPNDASGNGCNGVAYGGFNYVPGVVGQGVSLNGSNAYVEVISNDTLNPRDGSFSYAFWVKTTKATDNFGYMIGRYDQVVDQSTLWQNKTWGIQLIQDQNGDFLYGYFRDGITTEGNHSSPILSSLNIADGKFHYITAIRDKSTNLIKYYFDGQLIKSIEDASEDINVVNNLIFGTHGNWGYYFEGIIDEARIYNRALYENEIQELFHQGQSTLSNGLVAYYPFNGNANDASGNDNHGNAFGAVLTADIFGNPNSAYYFDGIDDYIEIPNDISLNFGIEDFAISLWLKYPSQAGGNYDYSTVFIKAENPNNPYEGITLFVDYRTPGVACFRTTYDYEMFSNSNNLNNDAWRHFVLVRQNGILKIFINGSLDNSQNLPITNVSNNANIFLGRNHIYPTHQNFLGKMDNVRIYNRALSDAEIQELYNQMK